MDQKQIADEHIVARYLADQLSPEEAEAFEAYYTQHPKMVREIEYALRLKEGLATLRDRQQLDALLRAKSGGRRWAMPLSIAAALVGVLIGTWTWYGSANAAPPVAATLAGLAKGPSPTISLGGKYLLVRVRSTDSAPLQIPIPAVRSALELQVLPGGGAEEAPYHLTIDQLGSEGKADHVGDISGLRPGSDGLVAVWLDSARLHPGRHSVELTSERGEAGMPAERFVIELR